MEKGYKKLIAWQRADSLAYHVYLESRTFPKEELYGITSQLRRAAISIPINIAEGSGRQHQKEFKQFINIALGSLAEVECLIDLTFKLSLLSKESHTRLQALRQTVGNLTWRLYQSL